MSTSTNPNTLSDIITKIRRITGRPSQFQISDSDIISYINTFYLNDFPEHLRLQSLRVNYQFTTTANIPVYDFPTGLYLTNMPPVYIANYQSYMTQSRENFFRINPELNFLQQNLYTGNGSSTTPYTGEFLTQTPILPGFKRNPPGAYSATPVPPAQINWNVMISGLGPANAVSGISPSYSLVDDGQGNLYAVDDVLDAFGNLPAPRGSVNYITGAVTINQFASGGVAVAIPNGNPINAAYVPYVPTLPMSVAFYQDQFLLYPIPDQAYNVSFEAYMYPTAFMATNTAATPQLTEWWQLLAYGAADKIFSDNGDFENMQKFRALLKEQMDLVQRRTIVQYTGERTMSIYTEQSQFPQYPFGNLFSGF